MEFLLDNKLKLESSDVSSASHTPTDDNLIIANKPSVSELGNSDSQPIIIEYKGKKNLSYDTKRNTLASTDSSWGSSSDCSTISDDNLDQSITTEPKVRFSPSDVATGKSVSNLSKPSTKASNNSNNKAVSLPVLESESDIASSSQANKDFKSDPERIMITDNKEEGDTPTPEIVSNVDIVDPNRPESVAHRGTISRQGAVRLSSTRSRSGLRVRRPRTDSGSPAASLLNQESEGGSEIKHLAMTYEDTSAGAVHCFQDERGQWFTYTFGDDSAQPIAQPSPLVELIQNLPSTSGQRLEK